MKKMNRSQSSYRQQYVPQYPVKSIMPTMNQIQNKENNSLFQSVSQRNFHNKSHIISDFQASKQQKRAKRQIDYTNNIINKTQRSTSPIQKIGNSQRTRNYNYSEQVYQLQIQNLKKLLQQRQEQLDIYKNQYSTRMQNDDFRSERSEQMEQQQKGKNLMIKQLNSKQIQITNLKQRIKLHRSEIDTLRIYVGEKDMKIKQLQQKLGHVDMKKKKIQNYQSKIKQSSDILQQLQSRVIVLYGFGDPIQYVLLFVLFISYLILQPQFINNLT